MNHRPHRSLRPLLATAVAGQLLLVGCTSLPQAALIYSSRVSGGVDISSSATDTNAVSASIGYKSVDFAYVPLAVAPPVPASGAAGQGESAPLMRLFASHGEGAMDARNLPPEQRERITAYAEATAELAKLQNKVKSVQGEINKLKETPQPAGAASAADRSSQLQRHEGLLKDAQAAVTEQTKLVEQRLQEAGRAIEMLTSRRVDAMSVYGRFDNTGSAQTPAPAASAAGLSAGLTVGRVFSTGVAAQHLTEAGKYEARTNCYAQYMKVVNLAPEAERPAMAAKANQACGLPQ